jgi:galactokinase
MIASNILELSEKTNIELVFKTAQSVGIDISGGRVRRTSSRFCLGVEHGDYNGTELFGVGTDRFIWFAYKASTNGRLRLFSANFPDDGIVDFDMDTIPAPRSASIAHSWARFAYGAVYILRREGYKITKGIDGVLYGNIPGGGMSRSASLSLNLILSLLDVNAIVIEDQLRIVDLAQMVENDYIGSPCGKLDQIMILLAKEGMGTHYNPVTRVIRYIPLGAGAADFRLVSLDTGTVRPGLEKSTYRIRRAECEELVALLKNAGYKISCLADVRDLSLYGRILAQFKMNHPALCLRLNYIYHAQQRFYEMLDAWKRGDIETVGRIFRADGLGLRDEYQISGPELEAMCDIARTVPGVLGERMLGGGDKGAAGALALSNSVDALKHAVDTHYPNQYPAYADAYAVHVCKVVDGVTVYDGIGTGNSHL